MDYLRFEKRVSSHTVTAYRNDLDQFSAFCAKTVGEFNVERTTTQQVRAWVLHLMEEGMSPRTVHRKISAVKAFYKHLCRRGLVDANPAEYVTLPKVRKKLPVFVEESGLNKLLDSETYFGDDFEGRRDRLIIALFYGTGIRLSELVNLKLRDVVPSESLIRVLGKRNKERLVPYPKEINSLLDEYLDARVHCEEEEDFLFLTSKGKKIYQKLVYRVVKKYLAFATSHSQKSPHVLRHTFATHLLNRGADLNAVKELLGHANLAATEVYTHTTFEKLRDSYKQAHPRGGKTD